MLSIFNITILSATVALLIFAFTLVIKKDKKGVVKYIISGAIVAILDFIVEFVGTSIGGWTYNESVYHILGLVPVELVILFFSLGVAIRYAWCCQYLLKQELDKMELNFNHVLYMAIVFSLVLMIRHVFLYRQSYLMIFAVPFGIWGVLNIDKENLEVSLIFAIAVFVLDFVIESVILKTGEYVYATGFNMNIPLLYSLLLLGLFGVMEKMHKLDPFIDSRFVHLLFRKSIYERREQIRKIVDKLTLNGDHNNND